MSEWFAVVLKCSLAGSYAIVLVYFVRFLLRKYPKSFSYFLWVVVFFRLICPISFNTHFSIMPEFISYPESIQQSVDQDYLQQSSQQLPSVAPGQTHKGHLTPTISEPSRTASIYEICSEIWMLGTISLWGYCFTSFATLKRKLKDSIQIKENIYQNKEITSPFVLGIVHPVIYLPVSIQDDELSYILMHETIHIQRKDYLIKPLSFLVICLHWFNPLAWIAWFSMSKDMEMSCDEAVIKKMGTSIKKEYSLSLLNMASTKTMFNASPLAFSDHNAKNRIINVLNYKTPAFWVMSVLALLITVFTLLLSSNQYKSPELKTALHDLSPYLKVNANEIEVLHQQTDGNMTIYTCTKEGQNKENLFFLIFKDGKLETCYFNLSSNVNYAFYTIDAAEKIAKQYALDVYQLDVEFENNLHLGNLVNYGPDSAYYGQIAHFVSKMNDLTISVSICTMTGDIVASSSSPMWTDSWICSHPLQSDNGYGMMVADNYVIFSKNHSATEIYPANISQNHISFNNTVIPCTQSFSLSMDGQSIDFQPFASISKHSAFYEDHLSQRIHADLNTEHDLSLYLARILRDYRKTYNKQVYLSAQKSLQSTSSRLLDDTQKTNWKAQHQFHIDMINQLISSRNDFQTSSRIHILNSYITHHAQFLSQGTQKLLGEYRNLYTIVSENGQMKIDKTITIPCEAFWNKVYFSHPEDLIEKFLNFFTYQDLSSIFQMMDYQDNALEMAQSFISIELKSVFLVSTQIEKHSAQAQISFKTVNYQTDAMGTVSQTKTPYLLTLECKETENGWMINSVTCQEEL